MSKTCGQCGVEKTASEFWKSGVHSYGLYPYCKDCAKRKTAEYRRRRDDGDPSYRERDRQRAKEWQLANRKRRNETVLRSLNRLREEVRAAYGGRCSCCGETEPIFLGIDHVNGGGGRDRAENKLFGIAMYRFLRNRGYPPEFRLLCHNCNLGRYLNGGACPHEANSAAR